MNNLDRLANILAQITDKELMKALLTDLLTKSELNDIQLRWRLVELLYEGHTQREIAKKLQVSLCKITRGAKELKKEESAFKRVLQLYY